MEETTTTTEKKERHLGRNIIRLRELQGIKQHDLAKKLGISQQAVSRMESSEEVDEERLEKVAEALGVSATAIKNFDQHAAVNLLNTIQHNTFDNQSNAMVYQQVFNPVEKITELYERLLKSEQEKVELLKTLLEKK